MVKIAPSILSADFSILGEQVKRVEKGGAEFLHIDVMDGHFVPNISFGFPIMKAIRNLSNLVFDVHLMIEEPGRYVDEFISAGADLITVHYEALAISFTSFILSKLYGIKLCPPNPGLTDIINTISNEGIKFLSIETGVPGFKAIPALHPLLFI